MRSSPDQAVVDGAAAGEEPRLRGRASGGGSGQQRVREAVQHGRRPSLQTDAGPRAETEAEHQNRQNRVSVGGSEEVLSVGITQEHESHLTENNIFLL